MPDTAPPKLELHASRLFTSWLRGANASLAFSTYQAGKLFLIGLKPDGSLSVFERTFQRAMGLSRTGSGFWLASLHDLIRFENFLGEGEAHDGYDALYVPLERRTTGDIDVHDIVVDAQGRPTFVATLFNCLATLDDKGSFRPVWKPPFIDRIAAEDRCHLNGLAADETGAPKYASAVGTTNVSDGWRDKRVGGGVLIDVPSGEVVATGLSMPHSPRLHDGAVWILNAGTGEIGRIDPKEGRFEPTAFVPGFLRGMAVIGDYAVIGSSRPRENRTFEGLPLNERIETEGVSARCGLRVVNLKTGDVEHRLEIDGLVEELYDVMVLPNVLRPAALGFKTDEIRTRVKPTAFL